jgi:hypothetical protein
MLNRVQVLSIGLLLKQICMKENLQNQSLVLEIQSNVIRSISQATFLIKLGITFNSLIFLFFWKFQSCQVVFFNLQNRLPILRNINEGLQILIRIEVACQA